MDEWKTSRGSSQIPAFGNWDYVNDLPITQYFECARQAGLIRYSNSSSSGECDPPSDDLYAVSHYPHKPPPRPKQGKLREKRGGMGSQQVQGNYYYSNKSNKDKEGSKKQGAGKVFNVTVKELPPPNSTTTTTTTTPSTKGGGGKRHHAVTKQQSNSQYQQPGSLTQPPTRPPKAVDEDLYKIPPELLKRKRRLGFFSRCLVPPCAV